MVEGGWQRRKDVRRCEDSLALAGWPPSHSLVGCSGVVLASILFYGGTCSRATVRLGEVVVADVDA